MIFSLNTNTLVIGSTVFGVGVLICLQKLVNATFTKAPPKPKESRKLEDAEPHEGQKVKRRRRDVENPDILDHSIMWKTL